MTFYVFSMSESITFETAAIEHKISLGLFSSSVVLPAQTLFCDVPFLFPSLSSLPCFLHCSGIFLSFSQKHDFCFLS